MSSIPIIPRDVLSEYGICFTCAFAPLLKSAYAAPAEPSKPQYLGSAGLSVVSLEQYQIQHKPRPHAIEPGNIYLRHCPFGPEERQPWVWHQ